MKKITAAIVLIFVTFATGGSCAETKHDGPSTYEKHAKHDRYYREPPRIGNINDYFTPESLQVAVGIDSLRVADSTWHNVGIYFKNMRYHDKPGKLERIVFVTTIEYVKANGTEYEITHAIYGTAKGEPRVADVNARDRSLMGMIDLGYDAVKRRGHLPTERQAKLFRAAYKSATAKK